MQLLTKIRKTCKHLEPSSRLYDIVSNNKLDLANPVEVREFILEFEKAMFKHPDSITESPPLVHTFAPGIYIRQITLPACMILTGKIHKHEHPNFLLKGKVSILTESDGVKILEAPQSIISPPGTKRLIYTHTETIWTTVHHNPTNERNIAKLEDELVTLSYDDFNLFMEGEKCHSLQ